MLEDLVFPAKIIGKRVRTKVDGHKVIRIFLDGKDVDYKVDAYSEVYRKLTGKQVIFEFGGAGTEF